MKTILKLKYLLLLTFFSSCKKVIDIHIHESDQQYVVEGIITNEPGSCKVLLTRTVHFSASNQFPDVSGAVVTLRDNGTVYTLSESQPGTYVNNLVPGIPGHLYELSVAINGQVITAACTMPQKVSMDTMYISPGPFGQFLFATVRYTDPAGMNNGYRFVQFKNSLQNPAIFWENDEFTDGQTVTVQLDGGVTKQDDPHNIRSGDSVTIEMQTVDEAIFQYWYSLRTAGGDGSANTAAPSNPLSNVKGGALGYFSAHTVDRRTVIVP
jgi:hypothetical protein